MDFVNFINWAFMALLSGSVIYFISIVKEVTTSINELNIKLAVLIEKTVHHERRLDKHEEQLDALLKGK